MRYVLPLLLSLITGPRYLPEIEWGNLWVHNIFRAYEFVFGRKVGVRVEMSTWVTPDSQSYTFHTLEALLAHVEARVRGLLPRFKLVKVYVPAFAYAGNSISPLNAPYLLAVAYDAPSSTSSGTGTSGSVSHTISGSDRVLMGGTASRGTNSTFTFGGVAMTARSTVTNVDTAKLFTFTNPAVGASNLDATFTVTNWAYGGVSLTGASGLFGTDATNSGTGTSTSLSVSSATDEMVVDIMVHGNGGAPATATGSNTSRWSIGTATVDCGAMSTAPGASSVSMAWTAGGSSVWATVGVSVRAAGGGAGFVPRLLSLGVG